MISMYIYYNVLYYCINLFVSLVDSTAQVYRIFTDLWRIRSLQVARTKITFDMDLLGEEQHQY